MEKIIPENSAANSFLSFFDKISTRTFFLLVFLFQVSLIFQGLDLSDEGFLSTFYSHIFSDPSSVSYCFMFWLTGIIGGAWTKLFSPLGLLGIRLGGAVVNTITVILTYHLLKNYLKPAYLKLGLILVVLSLNNDIKVLNYNTLSSLFYIIIISLLFNGLIKGQVGKIFLSGFFVGLNIFVRTPNILGLGLVLGIIYYYHLTGWSLVSILKQIFIFSLGCLAAVGCIIFVMRLMGHLPVFLDSMKLLFALEKGIKKPEIQGGYGIIRLLDLFRSNIVVALKYTLIPAIIVFVGLFSYNKIGNQTKLAKFVFSGIVLSGLIVVLVFIIDHQIDHFSMLFFTNGLILLTAACMFYASAENEIKLLFFFGCFFLLSYPLGSSDGVFTAGRYCLWIALPITIDYLFKIRSTNLTIAISRDKKEYAIKLWVSARQLTVTKWLLTGTLAFAGFYYVYYYPFFDRKNRVQMRYSLTSNKLKGIYTTKGRADVFNELLAESAKYMKANDYVIAYDNIAMFYYATGTIPLLTNPLPAVYSTDLFKSDLNSIYERSKILPPVIMQKIATVGPASKWPEELLPGDYAKTERNLDRNIILDSFLTKNNYKEVWSNKAFKILLPDDIHLSSK
jgi:hypothetical protein